MSTRLEATLGRVAAAWVDFSRRHARWVLLAALALTAGALVAAATRLGVSADTDRMLSEQLEFRRLDRELETALPALAHNLIVVVDAPTRERARTAANTLAERLARHPDLFRRIFRPGGGAFFERHGLLYLDLDTLEELADRLAAAQPFLAELARDPSLARLATLLTKALDADARGELHGFELDRALAGIAAGLEYGLGEGETPFSWDTWLDPRSETEKAPARALVVVQPELHFDRLTPAERALSVIRSEAQGLGAPGEVRVRVTGEAALSTEEMELVAGQARLAGVLSFLLVALLLWLGLRSLQLVAASLITLVVGLVWTAGFAALAVGHLNLMSVAFAVLFIGLGIDFAIHFAMRFHELLAHGASHAEALRGTGRSVGASLLLCAATTAIGFYVFIPTSYRGVAELGVISGTGMFISLIATLTLLPALLSLRPMVVRERRLAGSEPPEPALPRLPLRRPRMVLAMGLAVGLASLLIAPRAHFDASPLAVRDPRAPSVRAMRELLSDDSHSPWTIDLLAPDLRRARAEAERLATLPEVKRSLTVLDFVPSDQDEKREVLDDIALFVGTLPVPRLAEHPDLERARRALRSLRERLAVVARGSSRPRLAHSAEQLERAVDRTLAELERPDARPEQLAHLERGLLGELPGWIARLHRELEAEQVRLADLPPALRERYLAPDGRARIQVFPRHDVSSPAALERFVDAVRSVEPRASGPAVGFVESARAIVHALQQALGTGVAVIALLLWGLWRRIDDTLLVLAPLALAALVTTATTVLVGLSFNFADVIVLPLLLGIGVDSGIHLVHRHRSSDSSGRDLLHTSTARAVFFSALTTIASFASLGLSSHRGMASLGQLLTLGIGFTLLANLFVLPALLTWIGARRSARREACR